MTGWSSIPATLCSESGHARKRQPAAGEGSGPVSPPYCAQRPPFLGKVVAGVVLLQGAQRHGRLDQELDRLQRVPLLICDEVGYIPFDPQAANLMFMLVSRRYERASLVVTSNKPFSAWGEIFGDEVTAAAMIDRLVHHAQIFLLKGDSYRLQGKTSEPAGILHGQPNSPPRGGSVFNRRKGVSFHPALTSWLTGA
jgi:IstB-like ATP binding protein